MSLSRSLLFTSLSSRCDDPIEKVAERMVRDQIHRLPVTDLASGELVGIITTLDLARAITSLGLRDDGPAFDVA